MIDVCISQLKDLRDLLLQVVTIGKYVNKKSQRVEDPDGWFRAVSVTWGRKSRGRDARLRNMALCLCDYFLLKFFERLHDDVGVGSRRHNHHSRHADLL